MAEPIVIAVVETIANLLIEEARFLHGVRDQVEQLQLELNRMRSFLRDADGRQNEDETIKEWISQTRNLAYEADDLLESYAFGIASQRENVLKRLNNTVVRHKIGSRIKTLKSKIFYLNNSFQAYGIRETREGTSSSVQLFRRTYSHVVEDDFVALQDDIEMLVEYLVNDSDTDDNRVVSIYGMGGSGKTTLARKVYNHSKVQGHFQGFVWVCVSQQWQKRDILQGILTSLIPEERREIADMRDEELISKLSRVIENRKCLVVLDDIWSTDAWECIKEAFPMTKGCTKILMTTRNRDVGVQIGPSGFHHEPRLLTNLESWELLRRKLSRERFGQDPRDTHKMEELGKEMVKHCGGLPLAVVVLGGMLVTKKSLKEWESVSKNVKAYLRRGNNSVQHQGEVDKILALSYNDLPHKLKPCFLYLGRFPEDFDIHVMTLYELWIAEGMISQKDQIGEESMLNVAERYLGELAERCMVQLKVSQMPSLIRFMSCRLHDLMRDLSLRKAEEENFLLVANSHRRFNDYQVHESSSWSREIHRLALHFQEEDVPKYLPPQKAITGHLRSLTLLIMGNDRYEGRMLQEIVSQLNWSKMLRVLAIEGLSLAGIKLSKALGNLIHLRYLSLRYSYISSLPSSIVNLQHLQTLDLRSAEVHEIPNVLWKMKQLRHLHLPYYRFNSGCSKLRLDGLTKLEILSNFDTVTCSVQSLSTLTNLRALMAISFDSFEDIAEITTCLSNSNNISLEYLAISVDYDSRLLTTEKGFTTVRQLLSSSHLKELHLRGLVRILPKYKTDFPSSGLVELTLYQSEIEKDPMETLERLPSLQKLSLLNRAFVGKEMHFHAMGFPQLRYLWIRTMPNLELWTIDKEGAMPNLSVLGLFSCPNLKMIPDGLRSVTTLQSLYVGRMPEEFKDRLRVIDGREGEDFHKVRHVSAIVIQSY